MAVNVTSGGGTGYAYLYASFFSGIYWPLSLLVWVRNGSTNKSMLKLNSNASGDYVAVSTDSNGKAQIDEVDMGWYNQSWVSNQDISADNVWRPILAVWEGPNLRRIYTPADPKGIGSTQALDSGEWVWSNVMLYVGGGPTSFTFEGDLAEVCMWNKVLDSGDYAQLLAGLIPSELYPNQIIDYWSMKDYYSLASLRGNSLQAVGDCSQATSHPPMRSGIKQLSASGEHDKVSIDYIGAGTITAVANSTYSWNLTNLPVGDGLLIELAFNGDATTYGVTSARLSIDGYPQNIPIAGYGGAFIAFPTISAEKQTLYVTVTNNDLASAAPYLFRVRGHDRSKMIGWEGSFNSAQSAYVDFERSGSAVVCAFYGGQTTISNGGTGSGGEWHPAHSQSTPAMYGQYTYWSLKNNGRGWYQQSLASFSWTGWHFVEIRVGEKPRRKRYIVRNEPLTKMEYNVEIDWTNPLTRGMVGCVTADGIDLLNPAILSTPDPLIERRGGKYGASLWCPAGYNGGVESARNDLRRVRLNFPLTLIAFTDAVYGGAARGLIFGTGNGWWGGACISSSYGYRRVGLRTTDSQWEQNPSNQPWLSPLRAIVYDGAFTSCYDGTERWFYAARTGDVVYDTSYGHYAVFGTNPSEGDIGAQGNFYYGLVFNRAWTQQDFEQLNENPFQIFKRRRTIFTGSPVLTHKRRRVL